MPPAANQGVRPGPLVAGGPRLPTGAPQQPPSAGLARPSAPGPQGPAAAPTPNTLAGGAPGSAPLALVDARTLAALAGSAAQPTGRLVGPMAGPPPASSPRVDDAAPLVAPGARVGSGQPMRPGPPPALSAATPSEVRERIQLWMLTGVLNTSPFRFPPVEPLATGEPSSGRQGVTRGTTVSPLARGVPARPATPTPAELAPANDAPGPFNPLAANDGLPALGQAMFQEVSRRGGGASAAPSASQPGPLFVQTPAQPPGAQPSPVLGQQVQSAGGREPAKGAGPSSAKGPARPGAKPLDVAAGEAGERLARDGAPTRLDVPGLGLPRLR